MGADVWILGGYQSDFARNLTREGRDFADLTREVIEKTLADLMIDAIDIDVVHVANAFGEMFAAQGHLGAMPAPSAKTSGTTRLPATGQPAPPAVSRYWPPSPTCGPGTTGPPWWSAWNWRRPSPATPPPGIWGPQHGPGTRARTRNTCGRRCSPKSPIVRPPLRYRRPPPARHRRAEPGQCQTQSQRPDPRLAGSRPGRRRPY